MPKLPSSRVVETVLSKHGFKFVSQRGSHAKYRKLGSPTLTAIVPAGKKEIPQGTARSIARQARIDFKEFQK